MPNTITPETAAQILIQATSLACARINEFSNTVLRTRGGRVGSGMGTLLEALWGYYINQVLLNEGGEAAACEIGWLADNEYNDFACVLRDQPWAQADRTGELLRIEAKSMNAGADESKAHFDELSANLGPWDLLLVLVWSWDPADEFRVYPNVRDHYIGFARSIALLRDTLHVARGGSFVDRFSCPEGCPPKACRHHGEPLNASGKRERLSGPPSRRPDNVSYAANFGGLVRMLKTRSIAAREPFRRIRAEDESAHGYISFIHRNYPAEEKNQYGISEWRLVADRLGLTVPSGTSKDDLVAYIRKEAPLLYRSELHRIIEIEPPEMLARTE